MQGKKVFIPQLFYQTSLERLVPHDNFYRILSKELDLQFLYQSTEGYYGSEGQESIDPVVFFKILLVGYLNNLNSDRALLRFCSNCLDVRLHTKLTLAALCYNLKKYLKFTRKLPKFLAQMMTDPKGYCFLCKSIFISLNFS